MYKGSHYMEVVGMYIRIAMAGEEFSDHSVINMEVVG